MNCKPNKLWILSAAVAAMPILWLARPAAAQYPAGQDGHANDANNRVGSNGFNTPNTAGGPGVTGNQIVNRNVTAGYGFRGPVPYRDPGAFMGPVPGAGVDAFVRNSAGAPTRFSGPNDLTTTPRPFYGDARNVPPPAGSLPVGFNGGYVGTTLQSPSSLSSTLNAAPVDYGLQARTFTRNELERNALENPYGYQNIVPQPGEEPLLNMGVPMMASPVFGMRPQGFAFENTFNVNNANATGPGQGERFQTPGGSVEEMRRQMLEAAGVPQPLEMTPGQANQPGAGPQRNGPMLQGPGQPSQGQANPLVQPLNQPLEAPQTSTLGQPGLAQPLNSGPLNSGINTQQGIRQNFLVPPAMQSAQYSELQKRLDRYNASHPMTDEERNANFQRQVAKSKTGTLQGPNVARGGGAPGRAAPAPNAPPPMVMESLATGIRAKGLHDLMARAEDLMRQDKFATAIEQYDQAGRVAPNNPLVWLGRAIAELGAGYYAQADRDIRQVFRADPALLLAQVDLNKMMSADRLNFLRQDLSTLAANNPKDARPWFLQAFIAYNTGNASDAQHDLDEAEKRSGRADWTIRLLRNHWSLPGTGRPQTDGTTNVPQPPNPGAPETPTTRPAELNK